jgi:hypothetical protein
MCCVGCNGVRLSLAGPDHAVVDAAGRRWVFEQHSYFGPIVLRNDGLPKSRQPGSRSKFWTAWQTWRDAQNKESSDVKDARRDARADANGGG